MDEFRTIARLWPAGTELDLGVDSTNLNLTPPDSANFTRTAAPFVTSSDGTHNYEFLFWNTGRHLTNKRKVIWIFSQFGWGIWTATRWYGTPGGNGGPPRVHADALSLPADDVLSAGTPIDGPASTYAAGAFPFNGNDHEIGTANGGATVVAHSTMSGLDFAGWIALLWGGDPSGDFVETDAGTTGSFGSGGFYELVDAGSHPYSAAQNASVDLLAAYATPPPVKFTIPWWEQVASGFKIPLKGDPSPEDLLRLAVLEDLVQRTRPGSFAGPDFQGLIESASRMTREELTRAKQSLQTTLDLGRSALSAIDARLKQRSE